VRREALNKFCLRRSKIFTNRHRGLCFMVSTAPAFVLLEQSSHIQVYLDNRDLFAVLCVSSEYTAPYKLGLNLSRFVLSLEAARVSLFLARQCRVAFLCTCPRLERAVPLTPRLRVAPDSDSDSSSSRRIQTGTVWDVFYRPGYYHSRRPW
jgi:hypothetical protein